MKLIRSLGSFFLYSLSTTGRIGIFTGVSLIHCFSPPFYRKVLWHQLIEIGFYSLPAVGLTAIFTGMVLALQSFSGFGFSNENTISNVVVWGITRELGPVLAGLIVAGRIGASIAAEIATMRVTEQIDALITLSTNPYKYLIAPRIIASVIMLPMLVLVTDIIGVMGGFLVSIYDFGFDPVIYLRHTWIYIWYSQSYSLWFYYSYYGKLSWLSRNWWISGRREGDYKCGGFFVYLIVII